MNQTKTIKSLLTIMIAASALSLTACGGGDGGGSSPLPAGKVGTVGDGINASEFDAIQCGMNKDQVQAIVGDLPTSISGDKTGWNYQYPGTGYSASLWFPGGALKAKNNYLGSKDGQSVLCP